MSNKYHVFTVECDGHAPKLCRRLDQAKKFVPDWLLKTDAAGHVVARQDADGQPLIATVTHTHEEIEEDEIAKKRGLDIVKPDSKLPIVRQFCMVQSEDGWSILEMKPLSSSQIAAKANSAAEDLEKRAAALRAKAAAEVKARVKAKADEKDEEKDEEKVVK